MTPREKAFTQGYACACAILARHDLDPLTLWKEGGFAKENLQCVDPGDAELIEELYEDQDGEDE